MKGPEPIASFTCSNGSIIASFSRMMKAGRAGLARTWSTGPNLFLKVRSKLRSPVAASDSACAIIAWPSVARFAQRITEAAASLAVTGEPSWNFIP